MGLPSQMILFARLVETGSFSAAARVLSHTPSAASRQIGHREDRVGVRLLHRNQHGVSLTEEGRSFFDRCQVVAADVADAKELLSGLGEIRGTLHTVATVAFGKAQLLPILPAFLERYPDRRLKLELTDRPVDLAADDVDVAIRFSEQIDLRGPGAQTVSHVPEQV